MRGRLEPPFTESTSGIAWRALGSLKPLYFIFGRYKLKKTHGKNASGCLQAMLFERSRLTQSEKDAYRILPLDVRLFSVGSMNSRELVIPNDLSCDVTRS